MIPRFSQKNINNPYDDQNNAFQLTNEQRAKIDVLIQKMLLENDNLPPNLDPFWTRDASRNIRQTTNVADVTARVNSAAETVQPKSELQLAIEAKDGPKTLHFLCQVAVSSDELVALLEHLPELATRWLDSNPKAAEKISPHSVKYLIGTLQHNERLLLQLIACGMPVNCPGISPLHSAIWLGLIPTAIAMIDKGVDVSEQNGFGDTPLHDAVLRKLDVVVDKLLACGADVYARNRTGISPLERGRNHPFIYKKLCRYTVVSFLKQGDTARVNELLAKKTSLANEEYVAIWEHDCDLACKYLPVLTPHCPYSILESLMNDPTKDDFVFELFKHGVRLTEYEFLLTCKNYPELMCKVIPAFPQLVGRLSAVMLDELLQSPGCEELVLVCIANKVAISEHHLTTALRHNMAHVAHRLLCNGVCASTTPDHHKMTALHYAAKFGYKLLVRFIVSQNAQKLLFIRNGDGKTPREVAKAHGQHDAANVLHLYELSIACNMRDRTKVASLLAEQPLLDYPTFYEVCSAFPDLGCVAATKELVQAIPTPSFFIQQKYNELLLRFIDLGFKVPSIESCLRNGLPDVAEKCLHKGVQDINSLLYLAVKHGYTGIIKKLLALGANPLHSSILFQSLLYVALVEKKSELVALLTEHLPAGMQKLLLTEDLDILKTKCQKDAAFVRSCCSTTATPLEVALLLNDPTLAVTIMRKLTQEMQLQGIGILVARYPQAIAQIVDFFFEVDERHMFKGDLNLATTTIPPVALQEFTNFTARFKSVCRPDELFLLDGQEKTVDEVCAAVTYFCTIVQGEEKFSGTLEKGTPEFDEQYAHVRNSLNHLVLYLETADEKDVKAICLHLAEAAYLCFITYRAVAAELYNNYINQIAPTGDTAILLALQQLRKIIVEGGMASEAGVVSQAKSIHAIQYIKRTLGERLQLPDQAIHAQKLHYEADGFEGSVPSEAKLLKAFYRRYTPSALYEHTQSALLDARMQAAYIASSKRYVKHFVPGRAAYKAKKAELAQKETALLKKIMASETTTTEQTLGMSERAILLDDHRGQINNFILDENTGAAKPWPIILTLFNQQAIRIKISETVGGRV